jgi:hypothetical protein
MSAVTNKKGAQPYSASQSEIARSEIRLCTWRSWALATANGVCELAMRSCKNGKAQLPFFSGVQTSVL